METKDPVVALMDEHRLIERVVADMKRKSESIGSEGRAMPHYAIQVSDFFANYTDACHHGKEEDILFARLAERELSPEDAKAMDGLIREHEWARNTVKKLAQAGDRYAHGDTDALGEIAKDLKALAQFYPRHIEKEDGSFFKAARTYFSEDEWTAMAEEFRSFDASLVHVRYAKLVDDLEASVLEPASTSA